MGMHHTYSVVIVPLLIPSHEVTHLYIYLSHDRSAGDIQTQIILIYYLLQIREAKILEKCSYW